MIVLTKTCDVFVNRSGRGVTLLELVLVMMIIFILAGVVAPRFSDFFPALQVRTSADRIFAWAQKARTDAAVTAARQRLVFDPDGKKFWIDYEADPLKEPGTFILRGGAWGEEALPQEVEFESLEGLEKDPSGGGRLFVEFRPDGTSEEATVVVSNDRGDRRTLRVEAATSRVYFESGSAP